jgi:hypothetical protein
MSDNTPIEIHKSKNSIFFTEITEISKTNFSTIEYEYSSGESFVEKETRQLSELKLYTKEITLCKRVEIRE